VWPPMPVPERSRLTKGRCTLTLQVVVTLEATAEECRTTEDRLSERGRDMVAMLRATTGQVSLNATVIGPRGATVLT